MRDCCELRERLRGECQAIHEFIGVYRGKRATTAGIARSTPRRHGCRRDIARRCLRRRIGGRGSDDLHHLLAHLFERNTHALHHACCDTLALTHETKQEVFRANVGTADALCFIHRQLDDFCRAWRQAGVSYDNAITTTDNKFDRRTHFGQLHAQIREHSRRNAVALAYETEQQMLRADVVMVETLRFFLRKRKNFAAALRELFESLCAGRFQSCSSPEEKPGAFRLRGALQFAHSTLLSPTAFLAEPLFHRHGKTPFASIAESKAFLPLYRYLRFAPATFAGRGSTSCSEYWQRGLHRVPRRLRARAG